MGTAEYTAEKCREKVKEVRRAIIEQRDWLNHLLTWSNMEAGDREQATRAANLLERAHSALNEID